MVRSGAPDDEQRRRVLVIAYYFPPMGLSGVQRVAKFVKYLPEHGWDPVVLTVEPGGYFAFDPSLLQEIEATGTPVHRTPALDPARLFGRRKTVAYPSETSRKAWSWLSQFLFIPDNKIGWFLPALRTGKRLLKEQRLDAIFSSAPPYTAHLIGAALSRWSGVPLAVDFRDDWVDNPRHVYPTRLHREVQVGLERKVFRASRRVLTINRYISASLEARGAQNVAVLPHGYDPADFLDQPPRRAPEVMTLVHSGIFYDAQTPEFFLRGLAAFLARVPEARSRVKAIFVGFFPDAGKQLVEQLGLSDVMHAAGYRPHGEVPAYLLGADILWMTVGRRAGSESISTSKLFEYFGVGKPILALVPPGAAREALDGYGAAFLTPPDDVPAIAATLEDCFNGWEAGTLPEPDHSFVKQFDRRMLAGVLARHLDEMAG